MAVATYVGVVENGRVRLSDGVELKNNTQVYVIVPEQSGIETTLVPRVPGARLAYPEQAHLFEKQVIEAPHNAEL